MLHRSSKKSGSCEHDNELSSYVKGGTFLDQLLKNNSAPWFVLVSYHFVTIRTLQNVLCEYRHKLVDPVIGSRENIAIRSICLGIYTKWTNNRTDYKWNWHSRSVAMTLWLIHAFQRHCAFWKHRWKSFPSVIALNIFEWFKMRLFQSDFCCGEHQNGTRIKSGEYGGCWNTGIYFRPKSLCVEVHCRGAESICLARDSLT
jgi:hypothetical protein